MATRSWAFGKWRSGFLLQLHTTQQLLLTCLWGWRMKGAAVSAGELPVFCDLPFPLPLMREASWLSVIRDFWAWILSKGLAGSPGCQRQAGQGAGVPKSLVGLCQSLLKVILMDVQYRTLCLEPSVPEELVRNPCVSNVGFQQRETASSQNQCRV